MTFYLSFFIIFFSILYVILLMQTFTLVQIFVNFSLRPFSVSIFIATFLELKRLKIYAKERAIIVTSIPLSNKVIIDFFIIFTIIFRLAIIYNLSIKQMSPLLRISGFITIKTLLTCVAGCYSTRSDQLPKNVYYS